MPGRVQTPGYIVTYPKLKHPVGFFGVDPPKKTRQENPPKNPNQLKSNFIGIGDRGRGHVPPKFGKNIFRAIIT